MKKYIFICLLLGVFAGGLSSCNDNDEDGDAPDESLLSVSIESLSGSTSCAPDEYLEFKAHVKKGAVKYLSWQVDDGPESRGNIYRFEASENGVHKIKVTAVSAVGQTSDSVMVTVDDKLFTLSSIENWTGKGANRSVLGIQWVTGENLLAPADDEVFFLVWGYRWEPGTKKTGVDMLKAIAKNDSRLFVVLTDNKIAGLGYDGNGDGKFRATNGKITFTQDDFKDGVYTIPEGIDDIKTTAGDYWLGGKSKSYASYWLGKSNVLPEEDDFSYSLLYSVNRELSDYSWDVWTWSPFDGVGVQNMRPIFRLVKAAAASK